MSGQQNTDRIQTTHIGSLPRPHDLLDIMKAKLNKQPYDESEFQTSSRKAVADCVKQAGRVRHRHRHRRRILQARLLHLHPAAAGGLRGAPEPEADPVPAGGRGIPGILRRVFQAGDDGRRAHPDHAGGLRRPGKVSRREAAADRHRQRESRGESRGHPRQTTSSCRRPRRQASASTSITSPTRSISTRSRPS